MNTQAHVQLGLGPYPWRKVAYIFGGALLIATIGGKFGWRAVGLAGVVAAWGGLLLAVLYVKPRPEATSARGYLIARPPALMRYGFPLVLCGPMLAVLLLAAPGSDPQHARYWGLLPGGVVAVLSAALFRRRIRLIDGGFEEIGLSGRAVRVPWASVKSVRYDEKYRCLVLVVRCSGRKDRTVVFPFAWNGVATLAAAALAAISEEALRPATQERLVLEQLAAFSTEAPA